MVETNNSIKVYLRGVLSWGVLLLAIITFFMVGCSWRKTTKDNDFSYLKGKHILVVINDFNRNPDVIEDWTDYKRYKWRQCESTGRSTIGLRNEDAFYLKPEVICCNIEFETDRKNIIFNYKGLDTCQLGRSSNIFNVK